MILMILLILIMGTYLLAIFVINPFFQFVDDTTFQWVSVYVMFTLLVVEIMVVGVSIMEIFKREMTLSERLWGAACIYLIIGIAFGGIYELAAIIDPMQIIFDVPLSSSHFMYSISYSFLVLGGIDNPYEVSQFIVRISTIEAVWGNLFVVFLVGRLLVHN